MPVAKEIYHAMDDPKMQKMVIDTQEKRERILADGAKVPYLYVHGAIPENEIKFILCIPEEENYEGRFFQYLSPFPGPDEEVASCLYTQIPESRINTELFNHHQKTEYPYNHTENAF